MVDWRHVHAPSSFAFRVHQSNVSGYTSKSMEFAVRFEVGSTVFLKWGAVEVRGVGDGRRVYWTSPPRTKTIRWGTVERAKVYAKPPQSQRRRNHRYRTIGRKNCDPGVEPPSVAPSSKTERRSPTILAFVDIVRSTEKAARLGEFALRHR